MADPGGGLGIDIGSTLESLADKSLLRIEPMDHGAPRFTRHTLIREFALEQLRASGEQPDCESRHAAVFLELAERAGPELTRAGSLRWLDVLDHEEHNLRAAIDWSIATGQVACGLRIVGATWRWWQIRARLREGRALLAQLLVHPRAGDDMRARIAGLAADGGLAYWLEDFGGSRRVYAERLEAAEATGDPRLIAEAHYDIGFIDLVDSDSVALRQHEEKALEIYASLGDQEGAVKARQALVLVYHLDGDLARARDLERENLEEFRRQGAPYRISDSSTLLGALSLQLGDADAARSLLRDSLRIDIAYGSAAGVIGSMGTMALVDLRHGDAERGARLAGRVRLLGHLTETTNAATQVLHLPDPADVALERFGPDLGATLLAEGEALSLEEAVSLALGEPVTDVQLRTLASAPAQTT